MYGYIFYSPRCETSANFLRILGTQNMSNLFNLISVEQMSTEQLISAGLKKVPTLVITDQNGQNQTWYETTEAFSWLNNFIQFRKQNIMKMTEMNRKKIVQANIAANSDNIAGVNGSENTHLSDSFSYVVNELLEYAQPKNFMPCGFDENFKIVTFQQDKSDDKISENDMRNKVTNFEKTRQNQTDSINSIINTQLKETIISKMQEGSI